MKILVTGSSGFAAEFLIPLLKHGGFDVIGLDQKTGKHTNLIQDISKSFDLTEKIDVIIHLAAKLEHDRCSKRDYFATNVLGTKSVLEIAKKQKAYFIYVSTTAIYGSPTSPISEKTNIKPIGDYALTKWRGEEICQELKHLIDICIVRPSVLVGRNRLGIYKIIFKNLFKNSSVPILGDGTNKISFVNIEDFCEFLVMLVHKRPSGLIVNFGGEIPGNLNEVIEELKQYTNSKSKILHIPLFLIGFLKLISKMKLIPITLWQLSVMHKDYYYNNEVLFSTGFRYRHNSIDALKSMADYYKLSFVKK